MADFRLLLVVTWISGFLLGGGALWLYQSLRVKHLAKKLKGPDALLDYQVRVRRGADMDLENDTLVVNTDDLKVAKLERRKMKQNKHPAYLVAQGRSRG